MSYFKKEFGQNFLTSRDFAKKLVEAANIGSDDTVLEIGAGAGMVTQYLVNCAKSVIAVEIDERFVKLLQNRFADYKNLKIINEDILKFNLQSANLNLQTYKVVGSLPYNISKKIIKEFLESLKPPESITVIVQKEVGQDYTAQPPKATFLSNYARVFAEAKYIKTVPKEYFKPEPKVDGAIVQFKMINKKNGESENFAKFLKTAFLNPRKKLLNNLSASHRLEKSELVDIFKQLNLDINARASNLKFEEWHGLYKQFAIENK